MGNYVNLEPLEAILVDCLYSVRYINTDHQDTPLTDQDYANLSIKLSEVLTQAKIILNTASAALDSTLNQKSFPNLNEATHIKKTRDKIFIQAVNVFLQYCNQEHKQFNEVHLEAAHTIATDSIQKLYGIAI